MSDKKRSRLWIAPPARANADGEQPFSGAGPACMSCGALTAGPYCVFCGQKQDDMRRSAGVLVSEFLRDIFSLDSKIWRTAGMVTTSPGHVQKRYAHGKRSQYTPPIRLFLVTSFIFLLSLTFTNTMFAAIDVQLPEDGEVQAGERSVYVEDVEAGCPLAVVFRFFVKPSDLLAEGEDVTACIDEGREQLIESANGEGEAASVDLEADLERLDFIENAVAGLNAAIENPEDFNREFNNWLPRVMIFMAPILALIIGLFFRGPDALFFDHLVFAFYTHTFNFLVTSAVLWLGFFSVPYAAWIPNIVIPAYLIVALQRTYKRGVLKSIGSGIAISAIYIMSVMAVAIAIIWRIVLQGL